MGNTQWSQDSYKTLKKDYSTKSSQQIFTNTSLNKDMNPKGLTFRESRDSVTHPNSIAVAIFLDETGSMGKIPYKIVSEKMGDLMETLIKHNVADAHVLFGGIGDHYTDRSPLQVGQFEAGTEELNKWITALYLEGCGGGNGGESYLGAWLIGARHTSIDCFEKRGQKGFFFTIGDENNHTILESEKLKELMGYTEASDLTDTQLLAEVQRTYNVFHIHIQESHYKDDPVVLGYWKSKLNERCLLLEDYTKIAETIASVVAVTMGANLNTVLNSFDGSTALTVKNAISGALIDKSLNQTGNIITL